jgi:hypothetical protein
MKKIIWLGFMLLCLSPLFAQSGRIQSLLGTVEIKAAGESDWKPAEEGAVLEKDTFISTGFKSAAVIALGNSTVTVRPLTRLSLEEIISRENEETVLLNLRSGRIRSDVKPPAGGKVDFTVRSPTATASVRGTVFEFDTLNIRVSEGIVFLAPERGGNSAQVNAGQSGYVDVSSGEVKPPSTVNAEERSLPAVAGRTPPAVGTAAAVEDPGVRGQSSGGAAKGFAEIIINPVQEQP